MGHSFSKTISAPREFLSCVEEDRQGGVGNSNHCKRPKPSAKASSGIMPDGGCYHACERHRQHKFPREIHDLIDARPGQRAAKPDVNEEQCAKFREEPDVGGKEFEHADRRVPAAEK